MNKGKKITLIISIALVSITLLIGVTYALNYTQTSTNQELILGDIYMHYNEVSGLSIENAVPGSDYSSYFEFKISGKNTYTKKDIYYDFILNRGDIPTNKTEENRIPDEYLKFKLVSVDSSNQETILLEDKTYASLENKRIHVETIEKNTTSEVNRKYRLYMTIDNSLLIGNTNDAIFTFSEFENAFGSVKLSVTGDFNEKKADRNLELMVSKVKENLVPYTVSSVEEFTGGLVAINGTEGDDYGLLYNENNPSHTIREYRYSGRDVDNYIYYNCPDIVGDKNYGDLDYDYVSNCEVWRIVGIFEENGEEYLKIMHNNQITVGPEYYYYNGVDYFLVDEFGWTWNYPTSEISNNYNNWETSGLQYYLNTINDHYNPPEEGYLSKLSSTSKQLIRETIYYLGNYRENYADNTVTVDAYVHERGSIECSSDVVEDSYLKNCNVWNGNQATWKGKVALLYPSDYGYSASSNNWKTEKLYNYGNSATATTNWMQQTTNHINSEWFITPSSTSKDEVLICTEDGYIYSRSIDTNSVFIRPVVSLMSNIKLLKGEGTEELPYVVVLD